MFDALNAGIYTVDNFSTRTGKGRHSATCWRSYQFDLRAYFLMTKQQTLTEIKPLADRVVVAPLAKHESTASGILIPDSAKQDKPEQGTVVAVGPGKYDDGHLIPMTVQVGDTVLFSKYGFDEVKIEGAEYFIISEANILAVLAK